MVSGVFLIIIAIILVFIGIAGCIIPAIPGPPISYIALLVLQWAIKPFTTTFLVVWAVIVLIILILDYMLPIWTAKKFGATRQGIIGSILGMFIGMFLTPVGMLAGLIIGAIAGDMMAGRTTSQAAKSGIATFLGTLLTIGLKLLVSGIISFYVIYEIIKWMI